LSGSAFSVIIYVGSAIFHEHEFRCEPRDGVVIGGRKHQSSLPMCVCKTWCTVRCSKAYYPSEPEFYSNNHLVSSSSSNRLWAQKTGYAFVNVEIKYNKKNWRYVWTMKLCVFVPGADNVLKV
jgi:hypothetical protein